MSAESGQLHDELVAAGPVTTAASVHVRAVMKRASRSVAAGDLATPWEGGGRAIRKLYAERMQIEETFRDTKCRRWGFGLRYALR